MAPSLLRNIRLVGRTLYILGLLVLFAVPVDAHAQAEPEAPAGGEAAGPPASETTTTKLTCNDADADGQAWIDQMQKGVYKSVCGAGAWFDGLFGNPRFDQDSDSTYGRLGLFENYDRRDAFDTKVRLRARIALPAFHHRLRLTLNREEAPEAIEERPGDTENPLPRSFRSVSDEAWLLGLGYSKQSGLENGFDFGVGIRIRTPIDPYVKASYRHNVIFTPKTALRFRETPFWRDSRGLGATTQLALDHLLKPELLLRWNNVATVAEDTEGLDWGMNLTAYQDLRQRSAISYTALVRGETGADVAIQNYGFEARYRRQVWRRWLFLEVAGSVTWPRETLDEKREINPGAGVGFEMYFGRVPELELR
jgi:hypothetical protein